MEKFYQGKPCAQGHAGLRFLSTRHCVECARKATKERNAKRADANAARGHFKSHFAAKTRGKPEQRAHELAMYELNILAIFYEQVFDRAGWARREAVRHDV